MKYDIHIPECDENFPRSVSYTTTIGLENAMTAFRHCIYAGYDVISDIRNNVPPLTLARRILDKVGAYTALGLPYRSAADKIFITAPVLHELGVIMYKLYKEGESFDRYKNNGKFSKKFQYFFEFGIDRNPKLANDILLWDSLSSPCLNNIHYSSTPDSVMDFLGRIDEELGEIVVSYFENRNNWVNGNLKSRMRSIGRYVSHYRELVTRGLHSATVKGKMIKTHGAIYPELTITGVDIILEKLEKVNHVFNDIRDIHRCGEFLPEVGIELDAVDTNISYIQSARRNIMETAISKDALITLKAFGKPREEDYFKTMWVNGGRNPYEYVKPCGMRTSNLSHRFCYWVNKMQMFI